MTVLTEAKIRKLFKEAVIAENGTLELSNGDRLTPSARSFLNDHHIKVISNSSNFPSTDILFAKKEFVVIDKLENSAVYPLLSQLTKLYPYFLKSQRILHVSFQSDKCRQLESYLRVLEQVVGHRLLDDISKYDATLPTSQELHVIRISEQLDQESVMIAYDAADWKLSCYELYIELSILRKELEYKSDLGRDSFSLQVSHLLKALEVLIWLLVSE
ncbi:hypothetical protein BN1356_01936 [Streptococcus varani]|uniref:Ethanolamine utilization cobalamin adenosyltransferase n=1 Tax=Streptococcus varani TaxID=1608583 RepID=A0A0E4CTD4_9STRE|nr:hypothetical protein [Streptococcus varani]CQR25594.1 hypothetical protein BN1356_01936 [Streptococcus varani]